MNILERIRGLLTLPLSRKVFLALLMSALAWANAHYKLGMSDEVMLGLAAVVAAVILGIGVEDAAKALSVVKQIDPAEPAPVAPVLSPKAPPRLALLIAFAILLSNTGCVSDATRALAEKHYKLVVKLQGASVPDPSYTVDDAGPGPDGVTMTAKEKLSRYDAAKAEEVAGAAELVDALGGQR